MRHAFFACNREDKAYAGVATVCRAAATVPLSAEEGFTGLLALTPAERDPRVSPGPAPGSLWAGYTWEQLDAIEREGRVLVTDHGAFVLINVYGPNVGGKGGGLDAEGRVEERRAYKGEFYKGVSGVVL
ncbi:AP endonuclease 2 [Monoraphidium neglectum]|uniref:AP endonuclease 2 n=1 Tax=Monoraphidium neglectum TaxID=145388 RepID=A0A0D2LX61_9CHLO|nr:AP endonuclease 2 [Monoraphidium neglectum]KIY94091.1 AP endonuclease 2 [Monoraphidium neglectum]|eukprot:XP_013893111.1 AP endonuclease 2 [Monoraphidium neglectum]